MDIQPQSMLAALSVDRFRKRYLLLFISYLSMVFMLVMGMHHLGGDTGLQWLLFGSAALAAANIAYYHSRKKLEQSMFFQACLVTVFLLALVFHGGYEHTALYWVFPAPPILYGLLGPRLGSFLNGFLLAACSFMLFGPEFGQMHYGDANSSRFLAALFGLVLACGIKEHFRALSHQSMDLLQRSKEQLANTDALTGLANRRFFVDVLPVHFEQQPERFFPLCLIALDIDHFKHINDSFGHGSGDAVLSQIADLLKQKLRQHDIAIRMGGEEFLLILPRTRFEDAVLVANKLRQAIAQRRLLSNQPELVITSSFGVVQVQTISDLAHEVERADQRLYRAKANGRNQVCSES